MDRFQEGMKELVAAVPKSGDDLDALKRDVEVELEKSKLFASLEKSLDQPRIQIFQGLCGLFAALMVLGMWFRTIGVLTTRFFGFAYPAYMSFKAIESKDDDDDTHWLIYWLIFAIFSILEETLLRPFENYQAPFFVFKTLFLVWSFAPQTRGALLLYDLFLNPKYKKA